MCKLMIYKIIELNQFLIEKSASGYCSVSKMPLTARSEYSWSYGLHYYQEGGIGRYQHEPDHHL